MNVGKTLLVPSVLSLSAVETTNIPKIQVQRRMVIVMVTPRQLVLSVGSPRSGCMVSAAPISAIYDFLI
jgi:hypothetical protein